MMLTLRRGRDVVTQLLLALLAPEAASYVLPVTASKLIRDTAVQ